MLLWGIHSYAVFVPSPNRYVELVILISLIPTTKYALAALSTETDSSPKILAIFALEHADMQGGHFIGGPARVVGSTTYFAGINLHLLCDLLYYFINVSKVRAFLPF